MVLSEGREVTVDHIRQVSGIPELGTEVGPEVVGDEVHRRLVPQPADGVGVQAALVEPLEFDELLVLTVIKPQDEVWRISVVTGDKCQMLPFIFLSILLLLSSITEKLSRPRPPPGTDWRETLVSQPPHATLQIIIIIIIIVVIIIIIIIGPPHGLGEWG